MNKPLKPPCCNPIIVPVMNGVFIGDMGVPTVDIIPLKYQKIPNKKEVSCEEQRYTVHGKVPETILIKDSTGFEYNYSDLSECARDVYEDKSLSSTEVLNIVRDLVNHLQVNPTETRDIGALIKNEPSDIPTEDELYDIFISIIHAEEDSSWSDASTYEIMQEVRRVRQLLIEDSTKIAYIEFAKLFV